MKNRKLTEADVTDEKLFRQRRKLVRQMLAGGLVGAAAPLLPNQRLLAAAGERQTAFQELTKSQYSIGEKTTDYEYVTGYNNFYEFGTSKDAPAILARNFRTDPWSISVEGEVEKPREVSLEELLKPAVLEERIYRLRCVEAWSMVIPWVGFPLGQLLKKFNPTSRAKYVEFTTLYDPQQMPGQRSGVLDWPYVEGLRIDEAMHPLTILAVGVYGQHLPNQNGAPIRLVVPWKYGFKSIKSIVKIRLAETMPETTWNLSAPSEYGFYANVNPDVDHPRWSQKYERIIGASIFTPKRKTDMFNGYADEVAHLYQGMDLSKKY